MNIPRFNFQTAVLLALIAPLPLPVRAQMVGPSTEPVAARFEVGWHVRVTPDEATRKLGFEAYDDDYAFLPEFISSCELTRCGCVGFGFDEGSLWWKTLPNVSAFEAVRTRRKDRDYGEAVTLTWRGKLVGEKLSGELLITTGGNPIDPNDVQKELDAEREKVIKERAVFNNKWIMINRDQVEREIASQRSKPWSKRAQGRTIHYQFESVRTQIRPSGFPTTQPATQPSK